MPNQPLVMLLREMALYLEMAGEPFKSRAYERVAQTLEAMSEDIATLYREGGLKALEEIPGVGKGIASWIEEYCVHGRVKELEGLIKKFPVDAAGISAIEGVGPKMIKTLWQKLSIKTVDDLEKAARQGRVRKLSGFGEKSEKNIIRGIEFLKKSGGRFLLIEAHQLARAIEERLKKLPGVHKAIVAGSVRRRQETIGDLDFLAAASRPKEVMDFFASMPEVAHVYARGEAKTLVRLNNGMDADIRVVPSESFGAALQYFTGDKQHNIELRKIAIDQGFKLNEYGLFAGAKQNAGTNAKMRELELKERKIAGKTEEEIYQALGLQYIPPELRSDSGEIEAARNGTLPKLINYGDIKGDLQIQTNWADGANSIEEYAEEAIRLGYEYIAITDHTKALAMTGGLDENRLLRQKASIDRLNKKYDGRGFKILSGAEVNIMKDGSLDIADEALSELDVVGAAIHSYFRLPRQEETARLVRAMQNPHVDIIFHPTGRKIQRRDPIELDMEEILSSAKETGTILEIDASPERLDFKDEHIRQAAAKGAKFSIDTDAHAIAHLQFMEYGVAQARRGWATKEDIINTRPVGEMLELLKH
jgi:DNA polymerase (family 10)